MRRRPINEAATHSRRITPSAQTDAKALADMLDAADKPQGFPMRDMSRSNRATTPMQVSESHAITLAIATLLDLIEGGEVSAVDVLRRSARLEETHPTKARVKREVFREKLNRTRQAGLDDNTCLTLCGERFISPLSAICTCHAR